MKKPDKPDRRALRKRTASAWDRVIIDQLPPGVRGLADDFQSK